MTGYIEKSFSASDEDLKIINTFTRRKFEQDDLYIFSVSLCNNDIDRDYEKFSVQSLKELAKLFVGKTGISDHSMKSSDQRARIFDTYVEKAQGKKTADGEDFYELKAKAYMVKSEENMPFITEIDAGIKKEVSISCTAKKSLCSICGKDRRKERCTHIPGRVYDGKTAHCVLSDISDAYEFSFVAVPAQREAGVIKSYNLSKDGYDMTDIINTLKSCDGDITITKNQAREIFEYISQLEDEAQLGRDYKKDLASEVIRLCSEAMPNMDIKVFGGVAQVMTAKELQSFKKAFTKSKYDKAAKLQFNADSINNGVNQFKL